LPRPVDAVDIDVITNKVGQGWAREQLEPGKQTVFCRADPVQSIRLSYLVITNLAMNETVQVRNGFSVSADEEPCNPTGTPTP